MRGGDGLPLTCLDKTCTQSVRGSADAWTNGSGASSGHPPLSCVWGRAGKGKCAGPYSGPHTQTTDTQTHRQHPHASTPSVIARLPQRPIGSWPDEVAGRCVPPLKSRSTSSTSSTNSLASSHCSLTTFLKVTHFTVAPGVRPIMKFWKASGLDFSWIQRGNTSHKRHDDNGTRTRQTW